MKHTVLTLLLAGMAFAQVPAITSVANASGYQPLLAPDTVFVIFGSGLGPASIQIAGGPAYPPSLAGTSITFTPTSGGNPITAGMVYAVAGQIAGLLPSSIAPGTYSVKVTYNTQSSSGFSVTVVARSLGIATANSSGTGTAQATIGNINNGISLTRFTGGSVAFNGFNWTLSPAHPGDTVVLWGTGGGADPANDTGGSSGDQTAAGNFVVSVNGRSLVPLYSGTSSGYPGLWQVNFNLPSDIATGCFNYVQVSGGGQVSNGVIIPIAPPGQSNCVQPGLTTSFLAKLDSGAEISAGSFAIAKLTSSATGTITTAASGFIGRYTASAWLLPQIGPQFGFCTVYDRTFPVGGTDPASPEAELNAGSTLSLTGPSLPQGFGLTATSISLGTFYQNTLTNGAPAAGTYTLAGLGGTQVGPFTTSTAFPAAFNVTNNPPITTINRLQPLTINWTGTGADQVYVGITTNTRTGSSQRIVTLNCTIPGNLGTYTIPAAALAYLQPGPGTLAVEGQSTAGTFAPTLTSGGTLDYGLFVADLGTSGSVTVQ